MNIGRFMDYRSDLNDSSGSNKLANDAWERKSRHQFKAFVDKFQGYTQNVKHTSRRVGLTVPSKWDTDRQQDKHAGLYSPDCTVTYTSASSLSPPHSSFTGSSGRAVQGGLDNLSSLYTKEKLHSRQENDTFRSRSPIFTDEGPWSHEDREVCSIVYKDEEWPGHHYFSLGSSGDQRSGSLHARDETRRSGSLHARDETRRSGSMCDLEETVQSGSKHIKEENIRSGRKCDLDEPGRSGSNIHNRDPTRRSGYLQDRGENKSSGSLYDREESRQSGKSYNWEESRQSGNMRYQEEARQSGSKHYIDESRQSGKTFDRDVPWRSGNKYDREDTVKSGKIHDPKESRRSDDIYEREQAWRSGNVHDREERRSHLVYDRREAWGSETALKRDENRRNDSIYNREESRRSENLYDREEPRRSENMYDREELRRSENMYDREEPRRSEHMYDREEPRRSENKFDREEPRRSEHMYDREEPSHLRWPVQSHHYATEHGPVSPMWNTPNDTEERLSPDRKRLHSMDTFELHSDRKRSRHSPLASPPPPPILSTPLTYTPMDYSKPLPFKSSMAIDYGSIEKSLDFLEKLKKKQEILSKCELKIGELYKKKTTLASCPSTFFASVQKRYEDDNKISPILFAQKVSLTFNGIGRKSQLVEKPVGNLLNNVLQEKKSNNPNQKPESYSDTDDCQIVDEFPGIQDKVSASPDRSLKLPLSASTRKPTSPQRQHDTQVSSYARRNSPAKKASDRFESPRKSISPSSHRRERPPNIEKSLNPILEMAYGPMRGSSSAVTFNSGIDHLPPEMVSHSMEFHPDPQGYMHPSVGQETGAPIGGFGWPKSRPRKDTSPTSMLRSFNQVNIPTVPTPQSSYMPDRLPLKENMPVNRSKITLNLLPRNSVPDELSYLAEVNNFLAKVQGSKGEQREKVRGYGRNSSVVLSSDEDDDVIYVGETNKPGTSSFKEKSYHLNSRETHRYREGRPQGNNRSSRSDRNPDPKPLDNRSSRNDRDSDLKPPGEEDDLINDIIPNLRPGDEPELRNNREPGPPGLSPPPMRNICPDRLSWNAHSDSNTGIINNSTKPSATQQERLIKPTPCPNLLVIVDNKGFKKFSEGNNTNEDSYKKSTQIYSNKQRNTSQNSQLKDKEPVQQATVGGKDPPKTQSENIRSVKPADTEKNNSQTSQVVDKDSYVKKSRDSHHSTKKGNDREQKEGSNSHNLAEDNLTEEQASFAVEMSIGQESEKSSSHKNVKLKDIQSIFSEDCKMARDLREIQQNCSRLKIVFINTQRNKTINKNLCIRNELLCLNSEKLGLRIIASTVEEQVIYYFHCLADHTNNILPSLLRKYFTPIKELARKIESVHKSCKECSKLKDKCFNDKISDGEASLKSINSSSLACKPDVQKQLHQIGRNPTKPKRQPADIGDATVYPRADNSSNEPIDYEKSTSSARDHQGVTLKDPIINNPDVSKKSEGNAESLIDHNLESKNMVQTGIDEAKTKPTLENVDLAELDQPSRAKDPMSIVKEVQSKSSDIRQIISNINDSKYRSLYFLKNNLLLKRCKQDGKILPKIFIPNDITDEIIGVVHTKFLFHGNNSSTMNVMMKHFSPIPNLSERIGRYISLCPVCKTS